MESPPDPLSDNYDYDVNIDPTVKTMRISTAVHTANAASILSAAALSSRFDVYADLWREAGWSVDLQQLKSGSPVRPCRPHDMVLKRLDPFGLRACDGIAEIAMYSC